MKRFFFMLVVILATVSANAQVYVGGEMGIWYNDTQDKTFLSIAPSVGYEFDETWAIGTELKYAHKTDSYNKFELAPYARCSFYRNKMVKLFFDLGFGVSVTKPEVGDDITGWKIGAQPGIAIHLNKNFALLAKTGFVGFDDKCMDPSSKGFGAKFDGENLSFGIEYTF